MVDDTMVQDTMVQDTMVQDTMTRRHDDRRHDDRRHDDRQHDDRQHDDGRRHRRSVVGVDSIDDAVRDEFPRRRRRPGRSSAWRGCTTPTSAIRGELTYWVGARLGRRHCSLCEITHARDRGSVVTVAADPPMMMVAIDYIADADRASRAVRPEGSRLDGPVTASFSALPGMLQQAARSRGWGGLAPHVRMRPTPPMASRRPGTLSSVLSFAGLRRPIHPQASWFSFEPVMGDPDERNVNPHRQAAFQSSAEKLRARDSARRLQVDPHQLDVSGDRGYSVAVSKSARLSHGLTPHGKMLRPGARRVRRRVLRVPSGRAGRARRGADERGDGVERGGERVGQVLGEAVAARFGVEGHESPAGCERVVGVSGGGDGVAHVVERVAEQHEVVAVAGEAAGVGDFEADAVGDTGAAGGVACSGDRVVVEVEADEPTTAGIVGRGRSCSCRSRSRRRRPSLRRRACRVGRAPRRATRRSAGGCGTGD